MKKQNDGGDAFPTLYDSDGGVRYPGMTLRAYFAAAAPTMPEGWGAVNRDPQEEMACWSVAYADALIKELGE